MPPRRFQILSGLIIFLLISTVLFAGPQPVKEKVAGVTEHVTDALEEIPASIPNPFQTAHKPAEQSNSTSGESSWFADWTWRNPFSSAVTDDESRSVLPPLKTRPFVYTYYESTNKKDKALKQAEEKIILAWRRAWWAHGFKPLVLGQAEALNNPWYEKLLLLKNAELDPALEYEIRRWLAWQAMGTGILADWRAFPMGHPEDPLLSFLRRGEYPVVKAIGGLGNGLFYGSKNGIDDLIENVLDRPNDLSVVTTVIAAADKRFYMMDAEHTSIAWYDLKTVKAKYPSIATALQANGGEANGLHMLAQLINSHLHLTWQSIFSKGVAVLKPLRHMTALVEPALDIAKSLAQCPESPLPLSCPPKQKCQPCENGTEIQTMSYYKNESNLYVIGSVPHPYTAAALDNWPKTINVSFIRRRLTRDPWLAAITNETVPEGYGSSQRVVNFKDAVAGDHGEAHSLWLTTERETHEDLNWKFGFILPELNIPEAVETDPEPASAANEPKTGEPEFGASAATNTSAAPATTSSDNLSSEADPPSTEVSRDLSGDQQELTSERVTLKGVRKMLRSSSKNAVMLRKATEAWSQADAEAWRFTRAFSARRRMEREKWEKEEKGYAGADRKGWW